MKFSGFMNVYQIDDLCWKYIYGDKSHTADNLKDLEFLVRMHGLKWTVLDNDLAEKSRKIDKNNFTGFLNVYKDGEFWCYKRSKLKSHSLQTLKKRVLAEGLKWSETDKDLAYKNWKLDVRKFKK